MAKPVLNGKQVRALRTKLGLSLYECGKKLGYGGVYASQWMSQIERDYSDRHLSYAQANLLIAMAEGYQPVVEYEGA